MDGHKSHVSVGLSEWAQQNGIVLFILPAHTSHLLQPMDVSCYGPFERIYNVQCHKLMRESSATINRYNVCEVGCKVYTKALSPDNIISGFRRTGIFPLNVNSVPREYLLPAEVFKDNDSQETVEGGINVSEENIDTVEVSDGLTVDMFEQKEKRLKHVKSEKKVKARKTMSKIVSGKQINQDVLKKMSEHELSQTKKPSEKKEIPKKTQRIKTQTKKTSTNMLSVDPVPGPSHYNLVSDGEDSNSEIGEEELCYVCGLFTAEALSRCTSLSFVKWVQCDGFRNGYPCKHWVHLSFCTKVRVIRRGDKFLCSHCDTEE